MTRAIFGAAVAVLALLAAACTGGGAAQPEIVRSVVQRDSSPDVSESSLADLTGGNSAFAFDLYAALRENESNLFFSPFSISAALAMVYAGARNETERQMAETLHFSLPQESLHPAFNTLDRSLNDPDRSQDEYEFQLRVANSLWGQSGFEFKSEFLDLIAMNYGAGLSLVDFIDPANREDTRLAINQWVSDQTEVKIEDLVPSGVLNEATKLVLANAIYFNANWAQPFVRAEDGEFSLLDGQRITVQMMYDRSRRFARYVQGEGYQAIELGYTDRNAQMIVLLPAPGRSRRSKACWTKI